MAMKSPHALPFIPNNGIDVGIFDEAHRTAGTSDSTMFSVGLDNEYIKSKKRLFMTATERIVSPRIKQLASESEYTIFSMDDESIYGPVFSRLDFGMAIEQNIISDYKVLLVAINSSEIQNLLSSGEHFTTDGTNNLDIYTTLKQFILAKAINNIGISKTITYHSKVAQAQTFIFGSKNTLSFEDILNNIGNFDDKTCFFSHVNGTMSSATRSKIFSNFKNANISVMSNAACLTEGVDIPSIDAVYFVEPKSSIINIIQAIGRALRKSKEKHLDYSYIILPIIIDDSITKFSQIDPKNFDTLHMVIQALRDQDARLSEIIDDLNLKIVTHTTHSTNLGGHLQVWIPQKINLDEFSNSLSLRIADVNRNPTSSTISQITAIEDRTSSFVRVFRTIGDYNIEAYSTLVNPTVEKFKNIDDLMSNSELSINHNNVSHTLKIGLIELVKDKKYKLTSLGIEYKKGKMTFRDLFKRQVLRYFESNEKTTSILFPYRSFLKVMKNFEKISRLEFLYSIYTLKGSTDTDISNSISIINDIRLTYPNIEILSDENKKKVLSLLNLKYNTSFNFSDIWTSRTTTYNQFNYFKKHATIFDSIFSGDSSEIVKAPNGNQVIDSILSLDQGIESMNINELKTYYKSI